MADQTHRGLFAELLKRPDFQRGLAKSQTRLQAVAGWWDKPEVRAEAAAAVCEQLERLHSADLTTEPEWVETLVFVADICEFDATGLSSDEVVRKARAWAERERFRDRVRRESEKPERDPLDNVSDTAAGAYHALRKLCASDNEHRWFTRDEWADATIWKERHISRVANEELIPEGLVLKGPRNRGFRVATRDIK
ncbi:hypothetical protein [Botrimarina sp.]|uniref:hypothetical protein n=1 Tax=Botrimarina sp. TaxID=2795802 RepID=UPI0032EDA1D1